VGCAVAVVVVAVAAACADSPEVADPPSLPAPSWAAADDLGEVAPDPLADAPESTALSDGEFTGMIDDEVASQLEEPEPELIVGLESEDRFCRAWSRFTGTFQVLSVPAAFGLIDDAEVLRREVVSAGITVQSGAELIAALPGPAESEAEVVAELLVGPYASRATDALGALAVAGASDDDLTELDAVWLAALETYDWVDLELDLVLGDALEDLVGRSAVLFGERRPGWFDDTALDVGDFAIPLTFDYAVANCPDAGALAGIDAVD
jgi:hypothetical protein